MTPEEREAKARQILQSVEPETIDQKIERITSDIKEMKLQMNAIIKQNNSMVEGLSRIASYLKEKK